LQMSVPRVSAVIELAQHLICGRTLIAAAIRYLGGKGHFCLRQFVAAEVLCGTR
jgi:hypothetical protein